MRPKALCVLLTMIIELANVGIRPKAIDLDLLSEMIDLEVDGVTLTDGASFRGESFKADEKAHIRGVVAAVAEIACIRCLEPVRQNFEIPFDDIFVDEADEPTETELALEADDLDVSVAIGGQIDIAEVVREQLLLALPEKVFCKEDCRGLCPECGTNLNLLDCNCNDDKVDPRWSALRDLR